MQNNLDNKIISEYKSNSQKIRVMSETWTGENIFCPNCGCDISNYEKNKPVADFFCEQCLEEFELKSKKGKMGKKINAGAYSSMIQRINSIDKPNFFFMNYDDKDYFISDFFVIPKYFFTPAIIEKRKALSKTAKRAGWIGSNILFYKIPNSGKIFYIENGQEISKKQVIYKWSKTAFIREIKKDNLKGWILDIMNCIKSLDKQEFSLQEIYIFEKDLKVLHPENKNIKAKIRQQLQFLREKKYIQFIERGKYRLR
jgi:type II restriction enzyme